MPYEGTLYEFLSEVGLQQYHHGFVNKLGVTAIDHLAYVQTDDVLHVGMTAPEWRRLKASMKKVKKGKFKPGVSTMYLFSLGVFLSAGKRWGVEGNKRNKKSTV